jgi:hypothetical protein
MKIPATRAKKHGSNESPRAIAVIYDKYDKSTQTSMITPFHFNNTKIILNLI